MSDPSMLLAVLLAIVTMVSIARLFWRHKRNAPAGHARSWRLPVLVLAQPVLAVLLYFALLPPSAPGEAGTLIVATAGAQPGQGTEAILALPEAGALSGAERVPDLATALRRHPGTQRLRVIGAGLEARDRDAVRGLSLAFDPLALPRGLIELDAPTRAIGGGVLQVHGRANELRGGSAELVDPGRTRVDVVPLTEDGRFTLSATTRVAGLANFTLRLRDAQRRVVEDIALPTQVETPVAPRVLLLAGAPGPEVKYLRRYAQAAGLAMQAQMATGGGVQLGDAPVALNADMLKRFDVVVLDERAWSSLGASQRAALIDAVRNGLGVLLRVAGPAPDLRGLGFALKDGRDAADVQLAQARRDVDALRARLGPGTRDQSRRTIDALPDAPPVSRRTLQVTSADAVPLVRDIANAPIAWWRAEGRGRIALWPISDTYRLVLAGRDDVHAELWSSALATIARAQTANAIVVEGEARVGERVAICGIAPGARASATLLLPDPHARNCAAYWPRSAGWVDVQSGSQTTRFYVRDAADAPGLHANLLRDHTQRLVDDAPAMPQSTAQAPRTPGERWPWWLAWLLFSAALWWFERARIGTVRASNPRT